MLKLNGKPFTVKPVPPSTQKLIAVLDKSPKDEIFTTDQAANRAGLSFKTLRQSGFATQELVAPYTEKIGPVRYWGNKAAIAELRKQVNA